MFSPRWLVLCRCSLLLGRQSLDFCRYNHVQDRYNFIRGDHLLWSCLTFTWTARWVLCRPSCVSTQSLCFTQLCILHPVHGLSRAAGGPAACVYMENAQLQAGSAGSKAWLMVIREPGLFLTSMACLYLNWPRTSQGKGKLVALNSTRDLCGHSATQLGAPWGIAV